MATTVPLGNVVFIDLQHSRNSTLKVYDMKKDSVEINHNAPRSHNAVWNRKYMEPKPGDTLRQLWTDSELAIGHKSSPSYEVKEGDICRAVAAIADLPSSTLPDSPFILALGTPTAQNAPPQTGTLAQRALEEWERTLVRKQGSCDPCTDASRPTALIQKDGAKCSLPLSLTGHLRTPRHTVQETNWDAQREKACVNTYAHASASQICLQNICGQQQNFPMAGPTFGSKSGPQNGAQAKT